MEAIALSVRFDDSRLPTLANAALLTDTDFDKKGKSSHMIHDRFAGVKLLLSNERVIARILPSLRLAIIAFN